MSLEIIKNDDDYLKQRTYTNYGGSEMCEYCTKRNENEIKGKDFNLLPTFGFKNDRKYDSWILKHEMDRKAGIMIVTDNSNGVYFNINYCPMCGRKLGE